jgi:hypothetical protein
MATVGVAANARTRRRGYTPPQQPQRRRPGTAAKAAGHANMRSWWSGQASSDKPSAAGGQRRPGRMGTMRETPHRPAE